MTRRLLRLYLDMKLWERPTYAKIWSDKWEELNELVISDVSVLGIYHYSFVFFLCLMLDLRVKSKPTHVTSFREIRWCVNISNIMYREIHLRGVTKVETSF